MFNINGIDIVLRLRELRRVNGLSQREVALLSGIGEKSLSSFETGARIDAMKMGQLQRLLNVYGVTESEFFGDDFEDVLGIAIDGDEQETRPVSDMELLRDLRSLPLPIRDGLSEKIRLMVETAREVHTLAAPIRFESPQSDWEILNSRN